MTRVLYQDERLVIAATDTWLLADRRGARVDEARLDNPTDVARFARWNLPPTMSRYDLADALAVIRQEQEHALAS